MHPTNCLNCNEALIAGKPYCPNCSQKTDTHRLSFHEIRHDLVHAFTHADKGFFYLIKQLAFAPGVVAKEYIAGKRKRYYNPFNFLIIITGILVFASSTFRPFSSSTEQRKAPAGWSQMTAERRAKMEAIQRRSVQFSGFINKHTNIVLFISTPFLALMYWMFFKRRSFRYVEHLVTVTFFNGFLMIITSLVFAPLIHFTRPLPVYWMLMLVMVLAHIAYEAYGYRQLMDMEGATGYFKCFWISLVASMCWIIFSISAGSLYIIFGP